MYSVRIRKSPSEGDSNGNGNGNGNPPRAVEPSPPRHRHRRQGPPLHSSFTVGRIDLDEDQLGSERVLLVDDRNGHVYLWFGTMSTFKHRGFGLEAATRLKADSPKGGQVLYCTVYIRNMVLFIGVYCIVLFCIGGGFFVCGCGGGWFRLGRLYLAVL